MPVTTRTVEQYRRVRLPGPRPASRSCANGGRLLVDGVEDPGVPRRGGAPGRRGRAGREVRDAMASATRGDPGVLKRRVAQDLFCYLCSTTAPTRCRRRARRGRGRARAAGWSRCRAASSTCCPRAHQGARPWPRCWRGPGPTTWSPPVTRCSTPGCSRPPSRVAPLGARSWRARAGRGRTSADRRGRRPGGRGDRRVAARGRRGRPRRRVRGVDLSRQRALR